MAPHRIQQLVAQQQFIGVPQQQQQHGERLGLQRMKVAVTAERMRHGIHHDAVETVAFDHLPCVARVLDGTHRQNLTNSSETSAMTV
ncbi:hypothetical protein D3C81_887990 [compost metagenome]